MDIIIIGLSITSSWGNGQATTFRSLVKGLNKRGHNVLFLERDTPWYASNRDMPEAEFCRIALYNSVAELKEKFSAQTEQADAVIAGSYIPDGIEVAEFVLDNASGIKIFYDLDTPVTIAKLRSNSCEYLLSQQIPGFDIYLSFSAGQSLKILEYEFGSPEARPFYTSVDTELYYPLKCEKKWDLGYLGTYIDDRQPALEKLLIDPASKWEKGRFVVAGPQYPLSLKWPVNIELLGHLAPASHVNFYNAQRYTLNISRKDMVKMGYSPSVRLFEASACGIPVISDYWEGIETIFTPGKEILISNTPEDTLRYLKKITENQRNEIGEKARERILKYHTGEDRALELEQIISNRINDRKTFKKVYI